MNNQKFKRNITFIRHCECYVLNFDGSINYMRVNPSLTNEGIKRAEKLSGIFDHVIISPMARCIETFVYSDIKTNTKEINDLFRELILCPGDFRQSDAPEIMTEDKIAFQKRVLKAMNYLKSLEYNNICVITHSEWIKEALDLNYIPDYGESILKSFP